METLTIDQFQFGTKIEGFFIIKSSLCKSTTNNSKYLDMILGDQTGEVSAKLWECTEEDENKYINNTLVKVRGIVTEWKGQMQLKIEKIRLTTDEDGVDAANFVQVAPYTPEYMYNQILSYVNKIDNQDIKTIVSCILKEHKQSLMIFPAAMKNHHAVRSGLLYHIMTMLMTAEKLGQIYTFIDMDLLYGGIILHDIAKIYEMDANELGIVSEYTTEGQLLGHIIQAIKIVDRVAKKVGADEEMAMLLQHMILSHHYEPEFGSPKKPMFPEAELLHYIDMIDSRMYDMKKALENTPEGSFSDRIWSLENRKVYRANTINKADEEKSLA
ncbi:MAG: 3-5 exoribonuclease [Clostridiales bacterium]|nr:3-5 exoribonuclease [Clostridiales bacterium]MDK2933151.1 3-5 exoribonuclease [Clostridiales bacterium]